MMTQFVLTISIALSISFLCSILEACLLSLSNTDIAAMADRTPRMAAIWKRFKENIERPIAVILIINTFAHTIGASLSGSQFNELFGTKWIALYSIVFSFVMIQWTELLPKTIAVRYNKRVAAFTGLPFAFLVKLFSPLVYVAHLLNKPFEPKRRDQQKEGPIHDITVLAKFASLNKLISKEQEDIVSRAVHLSNKTVGDIMVSKNEMKFLSNTMSLADALVEAHVHHHTRLPLINGKNTNDVVGYVNFKDIVSALRLNPTNPTLQGIVRPILSVSEHESVNALLNKLTKSYQHIAIVKDTQNAIAGLVTLEDVIEAIVGEIEDEYDMLPNYFYNIAQNRYIAGGGIIPKYIRKQEFVSLPDIDIPLSQWLESLSSKAPKADDTITYQDMTFIVHKVRRAKIWEVIIEGVKPIDRKQ